jgi:hypothetical protein
MNWQSPETNSQPKLRLNCIEWEELMLSFQYETLVHNILPISRGNGTVKHESLAWFIKLLTIINFTSIWRYCQLTIARAESFQSAVLSLVLWYRLPFWASELPRATATATLESQSTQLELHRASSTE